MVDDGSSPPAKQPAKLTAELSQLLSALADGTLSDDQFTRLEGLLRDDPLARRLYLQYIDLDDTLADLPASPAPADTATSACRAPDASVELAPADSSQRGSRVGLPVGWQYAAAAVLLMGGMWLGSWWQLRQAPAALAGGIAQPGLPVPAATVPYVGELRVAIAAEWDPRGMTPVVGEPLLAGTLILRTGLAEIRFFSGALVVLEGPAELVLTSPFGGELRSGSLSADIPPSAIGFTIDTPASKVVDLGTRFGVRVAADGATETHVFSGQVDLAPQAPSQVAPQRLNQDQAARMQPTRTAAAPLTADPASFIHPTRKLGKLLIAGGFEQTQILEDVPIMAGVWGGDLCELTGTNGTVRPYEGQQMLRFVSASPRHSPFEPGNARGTARRISDMHQIVDLRGEARELLAAGATVEASAWFNRVAGDETTDTQFTLAVTACRGEPAVALAEGGWSHSKARLSHAITEVLTDADPRTWERAEVRLTAPPHADFLVVRVIAMENIHDDLHDNEFHGHFVDAVSLSLSVGPKLPPLPVTKKPRKRDPK